MGWRKNIQRENEIINIPNATGKKKKSSSERVGFFFPSPVSMFSLCFWNYKQIWLSKWVIDCLSKSECDPSVQVSAGSAGSALISSVACTVPASPAKHQNPPPLTKSSCPKEPTVKYETLGNQMVSVIRRAQIISMLVLNSTWFNSKLSKISYREL